MTIAARLWLSGIINAIILIAVVAFALWGANATNSTTLARRSARDTAAQLDEVLFDLLNAETGQRGYLLTGSDSYLVPFQDAIAVAEKHLEQLKAGVANQPDLLIRVLALDEVARNTIAELTESVELRRKQGFDAAMHGLLSGHGKDLMDRARSLDVTRRINGSILK